MPGWVQTTIGASLWALKTDVINNLKYFERINSELAEILALSAVIA